MDVLGNPCFPDNSSPPLETTMRLAHKVSSSFATPFYRGESRTLCCKAENLFPHLDGEITTWDSLELNSPKYKVVLNKAWGTEEKSVSCSSKKMAMCSCCKILLKIKTIFLRRTIDINIISASSGFCELRKICLTFMNGCYLKERQHMANLISGLEC